MTEDKALDLALEALENLFGIPDQWTGEGGGDVAVWRLGGSHRARAAITAIKQARSAPVQSCYCPNCEAMGKELAALKAQPAPVQEPVADAMARYLRVCSSGGMPKKLQESVQNLVYDAERLGYFKAATPPAAPVQEPVGKIESSDFGNCVQFFSGKMPPVGSWLYTTPPAAQRKWTGLTDEEYGAMYNTHLRNGGPIQHFARAIEAKLKDKNGV